MVDMTRLCKQLGSRQDLDSTTQRRLTQMRTSGSVGVMQAEVTWLFLLKWLFLQQTSITTMKLRV
jgi:hypothetical protein